MMGGPIDTAGADREQHAGPSARMVVRNNVIASSMIYPGAGGRISRSSSRGFMNMNLGDTHQPSRCSRMGEGDEESADATIRISAIAAG